MPTPAEIEKSLSDKTIELSKANDKITSLTADVEKGKTDLAAVSKERDEVKKALDESKAEVTKLKDENTKLVEKAADAELIAEVQKNYPHSKGTDVEKAAVLKAFKAIPDEAVRKNALDTLAKAEESAKAAATAKGKSPNETVNKENAATGDVQKDFDALVDKTATEKKISKAKATAEVMDTKEGRELYSKLREAKKD